MTFIENFRSARFTRTHIIIWVLYIAYEVSITYVITKELAPFFEFVNGYLLNILVFYVHAHYLLPKTNKKPLYLRIAYVVLEMVAYVVLKYIVTYLFLVCGLSKVNPFHQTDIFMIRSIWRFIYFAGLSTGYWFALNTILQREAIANLEKSKLLNELKQQQLEKRLREVDFAFLKSQINPHFLFNTLNFLYNSAVQTATHLAEPIMLLSGMMRYALTDTPQSGKVELIDEIEQIYSLIDLNQYRADQNLQLSFDVDGDNRNLKILPLLLLTPVENIFKYAALDDELHPAQVALRIEGKRLYFSIRNKKLKNNTALSNGLGMKNLQERLEAYYPKNYSLLVNNQPEDYQLELQVTL